MEIMTIVSTGAICILCFLVGAKVGQAVAKEKDIEMPTINPIKVYNEHLDRKEQEKEQKRLDTILHNIENYDGTGFNQKDIPR